MKGEADSKEARAREAARSIGWDHARAEVDSTEALESR